MILFTVHTPEGSVPRQHYTPLAGRKIVRYLPRIVALPQPEASESGWNVRLARPTRQGYFASARAECLFLLESHGTRGFRRCEGIITKACLLVKFDDDCRYVLLGSFDVFKRAELLPFC